MEQIVIFLTQYGWQMAMIALVGIILLGALKYSNAFSKIEKNKRKPVYFAISVGFSVGATIVYLLVIKQFTWPYLFAVSGAIYALNQAMYAVYETTTLRELTGKIVQLIKNRINNEDKGSE